MEQLILASPNGTEIKSLFYPNIDIEIGDSNNTFEMIFSRNDYEGIEEKSRIYIPGTEYGGLCRKYGTSTERNQVTVGGLTWRGMMQKKIIEPQAGADYAYARGELNQIIKTMVEAEFPGLFYGVSESTGITVNYQFNRYCTLLSGLQKMLKSKNYKLHIEYDNVLEGVVVSAVPIVDYSEEIELSSDSQLHYSFKDETDGVNHLILLGSGELAAREVIHLYADREGNISDTQTLFGIDEITDIYDYGGAETDDLISGSRDRFKETMSRKTFSMDVAELNLNIEIGDIVGGRDYLTGIYMAQPIGGKIYKLESGIESIEYRLEGSE